MKKLLMASVVLFLFSLSALLIQTSCSKTTAQPTPANVTQLNKIIYFKENGPNRRIWIANYDGSNAVQVPITIPPGRVFDQIIDHNSLAISPDGQTIFFTLMNSSGAPQSELYSCDTNGANLTLVPVGNVGKVRAY